MMEENKRLQMMTVPVNQLRQGPMIHESLPERVLETLREAYRLVGHLHATAFEQFEIDFLRDKNPESEAELWLAMGRAYSEFCKLRKITDRKRQLKVFSAILAGSHGESIPNKRLRKTYEKHCLELGISTVKIPIVQRQEPHGENND